MGLAGDFQGILVDMDGVLLDTMSAHVDAWVRAGAALGLEIDEREIYRREGEKGEISARDFIKAAGMMLTKARVQTLLDTKQRYLAQLSRGMKAFPHAADLLRACQDRQLKIALVTGTSRAEWERIFPAELRPYLAATICGDDVLHGKPNPEPYMTAARLLGLQGWQCLAVENAPYGIESAKTAGCYVVGVRSYLSDEDLGQADRLVDDLAELIRLL
ncbi:MAG: HAD family phosphatase [Myxococcales bacterium]|nr:HAD family phosphatase [Myxococcales bacterium]